MQQDLTDIDLKTPALTPFEPSPVCFYDYPDSSSCSEPETGFSTNIIFSSARHRPFSSNSRDICADRFIPVRHSLISNPLPLIIPDATVNPLGSEPRTEQELNSLKYRILLEENFHNPAKSSLQSKKLSHRKRHTMGSSTGSKVLQYQIPDRKEFNPDLMQLEHPFLIEDDNPILLSSLHRSNIPEKPYKVLDIPTLEDDFYLNPIDWSKLNNLAIALKDAVYQWSGTDGTIKRLCKLSEQTETYASVSWSPEGETLAAGTSTGKMELWDVNKKELIRKDLTPHAERVGCLAWLSPNLLSSGSKDSTIYLRDLRMNSNSDCVMKFKGHKQEVCSLKWSPNSFQLASGGNDHKVFIWNTKTSKSETRFTEHKAAIKALAWSPTQSGILLSGGGNNDKTIKVWNTLLQKNVASVDVGAQVCNLIFSPNGNEFVSTHGFPNNQVNVWKFPDFTKLKTLEDHKNRVLYLTLSPDGEKIVTGAGANDGSLRFWRVFQPIVKDGCASTMLSPSEFR